MNKLSLATFRAEVTPPVGHPLCAGWKDPAEEIGDPLFAQGIVLLGGEKPVVLCAVDWCEISNQSHVLWREKLALAVGTSPDRVAVQCLHAHCAPWPDEEAQRLVSQQKGLRQVMDPEWCASALARVATAAEAAVRKARPLTHIALGQARVGEVASNRRVYGTDGKVKAVRWTATKDPAVRAEPQGLIDPFLKTIAFWNEQTKLASLHYYAVHNTSYDDDCCVTNDFLGLARERRHAEDAPAPHIFFNGCAGNITAGKYNDGSKENRSLFTERIYQALVESERRLDHVPINDFEWRVQPVLLPPREDRTDADLLTRLGDTAPEQVHTRMKTAIHLAYRHRSGVPIPLTSLRLGERTWVLHLPGEPFIEFQLFAQQRRPDAFVAVAGYGDCGPGYLCLEKSFAEGGYEPTDSFISPRSETLVKNAIAALLANR